MEDLMRNSVIFLTWVLYSHMLLLVSMNHLDLLNYKSFKLINKFRTSTFSGRYFDYQSCPKGLCSSYHSCVMAAS